MNKKENMQFWDEIDAVSEEFVKNFLACSVESISLNDDEIFDISKLIQVTMLNSLNEYNIDTDTCYPYSDENY